MTSTLEWLKSQPHEGKFETISDALNYQHAISILGSDEYLLYLHWVIEQKQAEIEKLRAAPKVKPLVWYEKPKKQDQRIGRCGEISYTVRFSMGAWGYTRRGEIGLIVGPPGGTLFRSEADAIQGAEKDHERRILEALE